MDTSEQRIRMCEKATEVQALRSSLMQLILTNEKLHDKEQYIGDWFAFRHDEWKPGQYQIEVFHYDNDEGREILGAYSQFNDKNHWTLIWLPLQSQMQEMLTQRTSEDDAYSWEFHSGPVQLVFSFYRWVHKSSYLLQFSSMEQLWLAFVYHEKYKKVWDEADWMKEVDQP